MNPPRRSDIGELTGHLIDGRYQLGQPAGKGGMGVVYEAENLRIGRRVAVKVLHPALQRDEKMRRRLMREMRATSRIRHPNIVEILDFAEDDRAGLFLVMEYLEGSSLRALIRRHKRLPLPFVLKAAVQLSSALAATHAQGLIHRDLKPSNIRLLPDGSLKVLDFGLVKSFQPDEEEFSTITTGGIVYGTPWYMSPEQAGFKPLDQRSDVYGLGIVLYEMLTGRTPFVGDNPLDLITAQRDKPVPLPSRLDPPVTLPTSVELLLLKMLSKSPDQRQQSMNEVMDDLFSVAAQESLDVRDARAWLERPGLGDKAAVRPSTATETGGDQETVQISAPFWPPSEATHELRELVLQHFDELAEQMTDKLRETIPRYRMLDRGPLLGGVRTMLNAALDSFSAAPDEPLPDEIVRLAEQRGEQHFAVTESLGGFLIGRSLLRPLLRRAAGHDIDQLMRLGEEVDRRAIPFFLRLVELYFSNYTHELLQLNQRLEQSNEELAKLRGQLSDQLRSATDRLVGLERLKARVVESISSGLMLVERGSRRILMFNKAMERACGLGADQVLDRCLDDVLSFVDGVPQQEFVEQIRLHGEVGLRKLRVRTADGSERTLYVRGQALGDNEGKPRWTLFIAEDVTERERIVESFSRYVARDIVDRILREPGQPAPSGEQRRAVLLACGIRDFRGLARELQAPAVTDLLTDYIRVVSDAVFHHGGIVDSVVGDAVLVYFVRGSDERLDRAAIDAAIELSQRMAELNRRRAAEGKPEIDVGIGLHAGKVLFLDVGSERRMLRTVMGDAVLVAQSLQSVASGAEVLISEQLRAHGAADHLTVQSGPVVAVRGQSEPVAAFRVCSSAERDDESDTVRASPPPAT